MYTATVFIRRIGLSSESVISTQLEASWIVGYIFGETFSQILIDIGICEYLKCTTIVIERISNELEHLMKILRSYSTRANFFHAFYQSHSFLEHSGRLSE